MNDPWSLNCTEFRVLHRQCCAIAMHGGACSDTALSTTAGNRQFFISSRQPDNYRLPWTQRTDVHSRNSGKHTPLRSHHFSAVNPTAYEENADAKRDSAFRSNSVSRPFMLFSYFCGIAISDDIPFLAGESESTWWACSRLRALT